MASPRWALKDGVFTALLMIYESSEALCDRFHVARETLVEMGPHRRCPGETYQGWVKAQQRSFGAAPQRLGAVQQHLREAHRHMARQDWTVDGWVCFGVDGKQKLLAPPGDVTRKRRRKSA